MEKPKYNIGDTVYLYTDVEQLPRMITDIIYSYMFKKITYMVVCGVYTTEHYEMEISDTKLFNL